MGKKKTTTNLTSHRQKIVLVVAIVAIALLAVGTLTGKMYAGSAVCGNNVCEVGETMASCAEDCYSLCPKPAVCEHLSSLHEPRCVDAVCQPGEELICPQDCTEGFSEPAAKTVSLLDGILAWFM